VILPRAVTSVRESQIGLALAENWQLLPLSAIFLLAFTVRSVDVTTNPLGFFCDEASFGLNAHLILTTGKDEFGEFLPFLFRSFGEYKLPAFVYAELPFTAIFGRSELAVRLTASVIGSLTVLTTYLLGKEVFRSEGPSLASAGFLAIMPWHVHYSRTGLGDIIIYPLFLTLGLYLFLRAIREGRSLLLPVIVFGLVFYTYRAAWVVMPPLLGVVCILYFKELRSDRRLLLYAGVLLFILFPLIRHLLSDTTDRSSQAWIFNLKSQKSTLELFRDFYKSYFTQSFLFERGDNGPITRHYLPGHGVLYWLQAPLVIAGITWLVTRLNRRCVLVLLLIPLYPLAGALSDSSPISSRTIIGSVTFAMLTGAGVGALIDIGGRIPRPINTFVVGAVVVVIGAISLLSFRSYVTDYFDNYPRLASGYWGWQEGPQDVMNRFLQVQDQYDELYLDGDFNAPTVFIPFYTGKQCKKCAIGGTDRYKSDKRQLFALRAKNISPDKFNYEVLDTLTYPSGEQFLFLELRGPAVPSTPGMP
jgi:4-amino-4-deoxy-L-arabinose transferase-like glycosyltransferase